MLKIGSDVRVPDIGDGSITSIHYDDRMEPIYTVTMDESDATPTGYYLARECELRVRVSCDQCQMLSINGVACHETGCLNMDARWDRENECWIRQRKCFTCGCTVNSDDPCCDAIEQEGFEEEFDHYPGEEEDEDE